MACLSRRSSRGPHATPDGATAPRNAIIDATRKWRSLPRLVHVSRQRRRSDSRRCHRPCPRARDGSPRCRATGVEHIPSAPVSGANGASEPLTAGASTASASPVASPRHGSAHPAPARPAPPADGHFRGPVAPGLERRHPELLGQDQRRRVVLERLLALRRLPRSGDLAPEVERARLVPARALMARELERLPGVPAGLVQPAGREMRLAGVDQGPG